MNRKGYWLVALLAGILLANMIFLNGVLARYTSPTWASLVAHGIGALACLPLWKLVPVGVSESAPPPPWWSFFAGIPGAFTIILASITVNSAIGLTGTLSLMLLGQVMCGLVIDFFGFFQMERRRLTLSHFFEVLTIMTGTVLLVFFAR